MSPENFIAQFGHMPAVYQDATMYRVNAFTYGDINIDQTFYGYTIYQCLKRLAEEICQQKGEEYRDMEYTGSGERDLIIKLFKMQLKVPSWAVPFLETIQELPVIQRLELMNVTADDIKVYVTHVSSRLKEEALELLSKKWKYKETGDLISNESVITSDGRTLGMIKNRVKARTVTAIELEAIIKIFTGFNTELLEVTA